MYLGRKQPDSGPLSAAPVADSKPKITYPGFSLSDKVATQFTDEHEPKLGDEFAATVRLCVTSLTADEYGNRVQFDIKELDDVTPESEETDEDVAKASEGEDNEADDLEEKTLGYKRKKSEKEAPPIKASDLAD